jgi:hypothetical protein
MPIQCLLVANNVLVIATLLPDGPKDQCGGPQQYSCFLGPSGHARGGVDSTQMTHSRHHLCLAAGPFPGARFVAMLVAHKLAVRAFKGAAGRRDLLDSGCVLWPILPSRHALGTAAIWG